MSSPESRWSEFCANRDAALVRSARTVSSLQVVAVSKHHSAASIAEHFAAVPGFPRDLGENYLQELQLKAASPELTGVSPIWHFIGSLQSRKIADVCAVASVIHSVGREKELGLLAEILKTHGKVPSFYLQFNISGEGTKNGFEPSEAVGVVQLVACLGLQDHLLGLMGAAAPIDEVGERAVRASFSRLRKIRDNHFAGLKLNMGMSADFGIAIDEGSDLVRVGTILFGQRT